MKRSWALLAVVAALAVTGTAAAQQPPPVPAQLQPVLEVFGPAAAPGCRTAGLVGSTLATRGLADAYRALSPAFVVCGYVPPAKTPVACPADKPLENGVRSVAPALGSLLPIPTPLSTTIDTFTALNALVAAMSGQPLPGAITSLLLSASGCIVPKAPPIARGDQRFGLGGPAPNALGPGADVLCRLECAGRGRSDKEQRGSLPAAIGADGLPPLAPAPLGGRAASRPSTAPAFADDWGARLTTSFVLFALLAPLAVKSGAARR